MIARILIELIPLSVGLLVREVSPQYILTSLSLFQLVNMSMLPVSILARSPPYSTGHQLLVVSCLWLFSCLSILLWLFSWTFLQAYSGGNWG